MTGLHQIAGYDHDMSFRVRAPELQGVGWLNIGDGELSLQQLRGKVVLLDFWTFCCINCLHVLDELRELEQEFPDELVVIGVHSPKFVHEADPEAVRAAVDRYEVHHPVLNDPDLATWRQYAVRAWPTLVVIDPDGYVAGVYSGEGHLHALQTLIRDLVSRHEIRRDGHPYVAPIPESTLLRFPSKTVLLSDGHLAVADAGHHRLVMLAADGETVTGIVGDGQRGLVDGSFAEARFSEPSGLCELPASIAQRVGYDLVVADTVNHALRGVNTATQSVSTIAGTGAQWMQLDPLPQGIPAGTPMSSPWDVVWSEQHQAVIIAMAGIHQLWMFDPVAGTLAVLAGTTNEGLVDGPAKRAWFAQTSGLAVDAQGSVWLADSETSSLRVLQDGHITSVIGKGLFDFGHVDGSAREALLQHPLGLCVLPDSSVAIADTYNGAIRRYDPATETVTTIASGLREPSDVLLLSGALLVTESAAHQLVRVPIDAAIAADAASYKTKRPATSVAAGEFQLHIPFTAPEGQHLDDRYGPATHVVISSTPPELLVNGAYSGPQLEHTLVIANPTETGITSGVLHVAARAASCDSDAEFPACHVHQQDWGVPVVIEIGGATSLTLSLGGAAQ